MIDAIEEMCDLVATVGADVGEKERSGLSHSGTGPVASPTPKFPHPWSMAGNEAGEIVREEDVAGDHGQVPAQAQS